MYKIRRVYSFIPRNVLFSKEILKNSIANIENPDSYLKIKLSEFGTLQMQSQKIERNVKNKNEHIEGK